MRGFIRLLIATLFVLPFFAAPNAAQAQTVEVSFSYFHDQLAPFGQWRSSARWGDVWVPNVGRDFRPYSSAGRWENTTEYGTVWVSDYEWGEIPFHYGRWVWDPDLAWIWVPGYVWGPGWVAWRQGGANIGWFPMPPGDYYGDGMYGDDWSDYYGYRGWYGRGFDEAMFFSFWIFVPTHYLYMPHWHSYYIGFHDYHGFWGNTHNWTHYTIVNNIVINVSININEHPRMFGDVRTVSGRNLFHRPITTVNAGRAIASREMRHVGAAQRANFRGDFTRAFNSGKAGQAWRNRMQTGGTAISGGGRGPGAGVTGAGRGQGGAVTGAGRGAGQGPGVTGAGRAKGGAVTGAGRGAGPGPGVTGAGRGKTGAVTGAGRGKTGAVTGAGRGQGQVTGKGRGQTGAGATGQQQGQQGQGATQGKGKKKKCVGPNCPP